jgi:hypothetical protein
LWVLLFLGVVDLENNIQNPYHQYQNNNNNLFHLQMSPLQADVIEFSKKGWVEVER